jgi:4-hydroxy-2-oxoglutarate aldolase
MQNREKLSGVFVPVVTPFFNERISIDGLKRNLLKLNKTAVAGYLALGSNGEFMSLSYKEQIQVLEVFAANKGDKTVMVGTGCESTHHTIEFSKIAASMGFDYVSILTPHYFAKQMNGKTLKDYYLQIADAVPISVLFYNAPGFASGVTIPVDTVVELSKHPNIVGMKDSAPTGPAKYLNFINADADFSVLAGSANFFYPTLQLGCSGGVISLANALPDACCNLYQLFQEKKFDEAKELHFKLSRLNQAVSGSYGVAGVKAAMNIQGFEGGLPRLPLNPVADSAIENIRNAMIAEGFPGA